MIKLYIHESAFMIRQGIPSVAFRVLYETPRNGTATVPYDYGHDHESDIWVINEGSLPHLNLLPLGEEVYLTLKIAYYSYFFAFCVSLS